MDELYRKLLEKIGEDLNRPGLKATPRRAARAVEYLTKGYHEDIAKVINGAIFESDNDGMVIIKDIEIFSLCEHHLLPFYGRCHVGYLPNGKVIGISKIARIVDVFARRLQVQENLTKEIAETILKYTQAQGVGVVIEAKHLCMMMRGVEKQNSVMKTSYMLGLFRTQINTRSEFLNLIK